MALRINLRKIRPGYILKPRGKILKFVYYVRCGLRHFVPSFWLRRHKAELLETLDARTDKEQILDRVGVSGFLCLGRLFQGQPNEAALCI